MMDDFNHRLFKSCVDVRRAVVEKLESEHGVCVASLKRDEILQGLRLVGFVRQPREGIYICYLRFLNCNAETKGV